MEAFCFLTPFLRQFIPGRSELCKIIRGEDAGAPSKRKPKGEIAPFVWSPDKDAAFKLVKAAIANNVRKGYTQECSNVGQLLKNLSFTLNMESTLMGKVLDDKQKPDAAAKAWLKANPQVLDTWLAGVTTVDGKPGLEAVKAYLAK